MNQREDGATIAKEETCTHSLDKMTRRLGISTFVSLALTAFAGARKFKWISPKVHVGLGIHTLILATIHTAVSIYAAKKKQEAKEEKA